MAKTKYSEVAKNVFTKKDKVTNLMTRSNFADHERRLLHYYISFVQNHPDLIFVFSRDGNLLTNNFHKLNKRLGYRARQKIVYKDIVPQEQYENIITAFNDAKTGKSGSIQFDILNSENNYQHFIATIIPIESTSKYVEAISFILKDITDETRVDLINQIKMNHLERAQEIANVGSWEYDLQLNKFTCTKTLYHLIGLEPTEILTEEIILPFIHPFDRIPLINFFKQTLTNKVPHSAQFRIIHGKTRQLRHMKIKIAVESKNNEPIRLIGVVKDITNEVEMKQKLEHYATHDMITDLPNYYRLHEKLDELLQNKKIERFALLYINLDNFYWIINYLGHEMGDQVLKGIAKRLMSICPTNGFLAIEKSDSFVFLIEHYLNENELINFVEHMMKTVSKKLIIDDYEFHLTTSIGISLYPKHGTDKHVLFEKAFSALHYAKKLGKNNYQFYSMKESLNAHKRFTLERDLRKAIENDELRTYYQPQVNPKTNAMVGAEALIRWNNRTWGIVQPEEFLPIAEEKHVMNQIFDWQVRNVMKQLYEWKQSNIPLYPISINISSIQLLRPGLVETLEELLTEYDISPKYIILEITEGSPLQKDEFTIQTVKKIKNLGIKIAIDDFGTGYASFDYLKSFDFDIIKIDQSFIQNLTPNQINETKESAIVTAFLHIAQSLDLEIVAEGVETYEQLQFLQQKQCNAIQGYIYSKPVPAEEFRKLMIRRYLPPLKHKPKVDGRNLRRYYRFEFPFQVPAKMYITELATKMVNIGYAIILIENISIGGIRFLSHFKIPVVSGLILKFEFEMMGESFNFNGKLVYQDEEREGLYAYGVSFQSNEAEQHRLAKVINQMTVLKKLNEKIPNTQFITEEPSVFLHKQHRS